MVLPAAPKVAGSETATPMGSSQEVSFHKPSVSRNAHVGPVRSEPRGAPAFLFHPSNPSPVPDPDPDPDPQFQVHGIVPRLAFRPSQSPRPMRLWIKKWNQLFHGIVYLVTKLSNFEIFSVAQNTGKCNKHNHYIRKTFY